MGGGRGRPRTCAERAGRNLWDRGESSRRAKREDSRCARRPRNPRSLSGDPNHARPILRRGPRPGLVRAGGLVELRVDAGALADLALDALAVGARWVVAAHLVLVLWRVGGEVAQIGVLGRVGWELVPGAVAALARFRAEVVVVAPVVEPRPEGRLGTVQRRDLLERILVVVRAAPVAL